MKTKIFISWSGKDTNSFKIAKKLYEWLPMVLQTTEPFMSDNISAGTGFLNQIMGNLSTAKVGIICVTKDNIASPWLNFEAGALSNVVTTNKGLAIPLLIGMTTNELSTYNSPIKNFQAVEFNAEGVERMLYSINALLEYPLKESQLEKLFKQSIAMLLDEEMIEDSSENVTEKEEAEEEPSYIKFFREISDEYKACGNRPILYELGEYDDGEIEILESCNFITCKHYIHGGISIKPAGTGLKYIADHPLGK